MNENKQVELGKLFFEDGIPGFSHLQFFQLVQEDESPVFLIRSTEEKEVGFWVINPFSFFHTYEFSLSSGIKEALRINEQTPIAIFSIITVRNDNQVTANLKAPIVVNLSNRMGKQIVLQEEVYSIRQPLFVQQAADFE
ncbi:flagellar assembly protein FliW [Brevibacillus formosus]|uniref:flagellar assembly protein FliW n=1 Tax=Brevibacillus TaxID=55080 RepID=UPI000D0F63B8|nr:MULTISPECIES: flagellar assembly protein FliW [Brevibacillus]MBG9942271.1 flagellar assembly protein FliW [Brevibacillus formosus]MED1944701.1 flagellar assembly protein FliW [Brevibacillus formosus]MED1996612.1 flagellar assembly protein FliW [Brevibacillus formosus]MED2081581.1 flagellar assembly protein FliW [Brevibacillus formosus]PSK19980.1 flagellar assembly protein FliW [Brevibacillus sp. NRRL NRS-603]